MVGVPWSDLAGTSLDNRWRARMLGLTTAITGIIMLLIAPLIALLLSDAGPGFPDNYAWLFVASGAVFALSILPGLFFHELPGGKVVKKTPSFAEFLPQLGQVLRNDVPYRAFILTRVFVSLFMMSAPFYIGFATEELGLSSEVAVPTLLAMQTLGGITGALLYTWLGVRSNLNYMRLALVGIAFLPISALLADVAGPITLLFGFLMSGLAMNNLLSSFLNWVVGYAESDQRPIYVGLANTVVAVTSLIAPIIGGIVVQSFGYRPLFIVALIMVVSALFITLRYLRERELVTPILDMS